MERLSQEDPPPRSGCAGEWLGPRDLGSGLAVDSCGQDFGPGCAAYPWRPCAMSGILARLLALPSV